MYSQSMKVITLTNHVINHWINFIYCVYELKIPEGCC
jgi:hypothetical protein